MEKIPLKDTTFIMPVRIDREERLGNVLSVYRYLDNAFDTNFMICEASPKLTPDLESLSGYFFIEDGNRVFHHTYYRNKMIAKSKTPVVGIWDADILVPVEQIAASVDAIRLKGCSMSWPYSGICYGLTPERSGFFKETQDMDAIIDGKPEYHYGRHTTGGAFFVRKEDYIRMGMENEYIYGWGPEDTERLKRASILDYPISRIHGEIFHLWHPRGENSNYADKGNRIRNMNELMRICRMTPDFDNASPKFIFVSLNSIRMRYLNLSSYPPTRFSNSLF